MREFPFNTISDAVFHHALRQPEGLALVWGEERFSWARLADCVVRAAGFLAAHGLKPKERIGIALDNDAARVILGLAAMHMGAVTVELPVRMPAQALAARVARFGLAATVAPADGVASTARVALRIGAEWVGSLGYYQAMAPAELAADDFRVIILSSGSTGEPKGAVVTQKQRILRAGVYFDYLGEDWGGAQPAPLLLMAPAATSLIGQLLTLQILLGGTIVLLPAFSSAAETAVAIAAWEGAICPMPPGLIRPFIGMGEVGRPLLPKLRALISSGQPMSARDKFAVLTHVSPRLHDIYGASGFGLMAHADPKLVAVRPETVGRPVGGDGVAVEVVSAQGEVLVAGQRGHLRLRGPCVALGYFDAAPMQGAEGFDGGWYYPGEIASLDEAGFLTLHGRAAEVMHLAGGAVYPPEIEARLAGYGPVAGLAVTMLPGADGIAVFVVAGAGFDEAGFKGFCREMLTGQRHRVFVLDALPVTGNGKLDRMALQAMAREPA